MDNWPHAPLHSFTERGVYMVTAATLHKEHVFKAETDLDQLQNLLIELAQKYQWMLQAWAIFPNHYHFLAQSPEDPSNLKKLITHLHASSARNVNETHATPGRKVWHQYWDSHISFQPSYLARLNYVMNNPVKHKLVDDANDYKWCSARWFQKNANTAYYNTVKNIKVDQVNINDDF